MRFDSWRYLYPPRPVSSGAVAPNFLGHYEREGWIAQAKLNGTCNVMAVAPDRKTIKAMSRHADSHKMWMPSARTAAPFADLPGGGWYVFVAELMHSKVSGGPRDTNYINDILVADGEYLVGTTFAERHQILFDLFGASPDADGPQSHIVIDDRTWLARPHTSGFSGLFTSLTQTEMNEGIVLKNPRGKLALCSKEASNTNWLAKCRRGGKNYSY